MAEAAPMLDDARRDAASIAYALLRVEEPMANLFDAKPPPAQGVVGRDTYVFAPSWRSVARADVVPFLAALPSPALLSPTTTRGLVALILLHELTDDRRRWAEKTFSNNVAGLNSLVSQLRLRDDAPVLLELPDETSVYPLPTIRLWLELFAGQVGWSLSPLAHDPRAEAQLAIRRSDGTWFPPLSCAPRRPAT